ncbi:polyprenyl synthetase family protein [Methylacidimicrobium sp. B4]|uniref:polyprenyl synthetase family protein n=1 Tax=Methylacidimicrobium sp. B4 TaxID=2796139 RepID=UPI001A8CD081|nr:polyprenyl synthetase family protein [Methylacidimicrobium sp. B4]QSR85585.1 polyprenyl synthetase family protein [Methylacidimicrobium sp. B4]
MQRSLRVAILRSLTNSGSLFRAQLAYGAMVAVGFSTELAKKFACAIEYFHIASLLLDDLPCMDDSRERRGRICLHLLHGEPTAILGSLALITRAYALFGEVSTRIPTRRQTEACRLLERCLGSGGIVNGQAEDLAYRTGGRREVLRIALGKTVPLIRLALGFPSLAANLPARQRLLLHRISVYWGLLYQGIDDIHDASEPVSLVLLAEGRDAHLCRPNLLLAVGRERTVASLLRLSALARRAVNLLAGDRRFGFLKPVQQAISERLASSLLKVREINWHGFSQAHLS